ncbi:hypothetical protein CROQUDRAFT_660340 [Cronartium quercuum f. sp. fusiforme G11]|uniref:Mitochondrial glyco protein n=1 Tax=Cronartium quercuum f. sp. fusiforme G11 TaxID=708437 RepID=A0A9P6NDX1_9BASI|nr:hypothetical protein CROQUDRAFT_660340 [Cronartium quercuum f. sp. fusiforme G11]
MFARSILSVSRRATQTRSSKAISTKLTNLPNISPSSSSSLARPLYFSTSNPIRSAGQTDSTLVEKLQAEIGYETEIDSTKEPTWLKSFKADQTFTIEDVAGSDEVALTRNFGNEKIRVLFSCSDIERMDDEEEDVDLELEGPDGEKSVVSNTRIRTAISIVKSGKGGLVIDCTTDGTGFEIDNVSFYDDEHLALDESAEDDWNRRGLYIGPTFIDLDESLQQSFTEFLEERGIGSELALIVSNMADHKEQKEYVNWLTKMSKFIKA